MEPGLHQRDIGELAADIGREHGLTLVTTSLDGGLVSTGLSGNARLAASVPRPRPGDASAPTPRQDDYSILVQTTVFPNRDSPT